MGTWPRSTPCTGQQTPSEKDAADLLGAWQHVDIESKKALAKKDLLTQSYSFLADYWSVPHKMGN